MIPCQERELEWRERRKWRSWRMRTRGQLLSVPDIKVFIPSWTEEKDKKNLSHVFTIKSIRTNLYEKPAEQMPLRRGLGKSLKKGVRKNSHRTKKAWEHTLKPILTTYSWNLVAHVAICMQGSVKWKPWDNESDHENGDVAGVGVVHNCTIFLCSLDVRNIVQGGDPLYAGFFSTQGYGGYTWPNWVRFFAKNTCL